MNLKRLNIVVISVLLLGIAGGLFSWHFTAKKSNKQSPVSYPINRQVSYSFTLTNTTARVIEGAEFWSFAPVKQTATQICTSIKSSHNYNLVIDNHGNQILHYTFEAIPPYGSKIITVTADLNLSKHFNTAGAGDPKLFLRNEKYIETDHRDIIETARMFSTSDNEKTARNIFDWIVGNIQYSGYTAKDRGALQALSTRSGDCTEFMYLFAALSRANKIPARCMGGYICPDNTVLKPAGLHNWSEIFHDGTWKIVDAQKQVFMKNTDGYIATRIIDHSQAADRFMKFKVKGKGLKAKMNG